MKVTRIEIEGPNGKAAVVRDGAKVRIEGEFLVKAVDTAKGTCLVKEAFRRAFPVTARRGNVVIHAQDLQAYLDSYRGTNTDVAVYLRVIDQVLGA